MPLPMVHLAVAREYAKGKSDLISCPEYYLGSISPDAIHMRANAQKSDKKITHLSAEDGESWKANVTGFISRSKDKSDYNFILGYGIHILTDIIWNETLFREFKQKYENDPVPIQEMTWAYYNDTDKLDFDMYREFEWREEIWELLKKAKSVGIDGILSSDEIEAWKYRTLHWFDKGESEHKNPIRYIFLDDIYVFIQRAGEKIKSILDTAELQV